MKKWQVYVLLTCLCVVTLILRLYFSFSTPYFSDDESYFHLRHIEHIRESYTPLFYDPLSFSGRLFLFSPLFHYFFAFVTSFGSAWYVMKIIPNLLATSLTIIIYFVAEEINGSRSIALFTATIASFTPIFFVETVNSLSPRVLVIPLAFLFLLFYYRLASHRFVFGTAFLFSLLILVDASSLLLVFGLLFSLFLQKIYTIEIKKEEKEFLLFGLLLSLWFYLLLYKRALLNHGMDILWQNIPIQVLDKYYVSITIISSLYHIGITPILFSLLVLYFILFKEPWKYATEKYGQLYAHEQQRKIVPIIALIFVITIMLWFQIVEWNIGLVFLSLLLVVLSGHGYLLFQQYLHKTKMRRFSGVIFFSIFCLFLATSLLPLVEFTQERLATTITREEIQLLRLLPEITRSDAVIFSLVDDGHYVEYFANRKTVVDSNFLQIPDAKKRLDDSTTLFTTQSKIVATKIMNTYNASYIYLSPTAKTIYGIEYLPYEDNECITLIYTGGVRLYESTCTVETTLGERS